MVKNNKNTELKKNLYAQIKKTGYEKMSTDSFQQILKELDELDAPITEYGKAAVRKVLRDLMSMTSLDLASKNRYNNILLFTNNPYSSNTDYQKLVNLNNRALTLLGKMQVGAISSGAGVGAGMAAPAELQQRQRVDPAGHTSFDQNPNPRHRLTPKEVQKARDVATKKCSREIGEIGIIEFGIEKLKKYGWFPSMLVGLLSPIPAKPSAGAGGASVSRGSRERNEAIEAAMIAKSKTVQYIKTFMEESLGPLSPFAPSSANLKHATLGQHATLSFGGAFSLGFLIFGLCSDTWGLTIQDHDKILQTLCLLPAETKWVITNFLVGKNGELTESMLKAFGTQCSAESGVFSTRMQEIMNLRLPTGKVGYEEFHGVIRRILGHGDFTDRNYIFQPEILRADYINESAVQVARVSGQRKEILEMIEWAGGTNPQSMMSTINNPTALNAFDAARRNDFRLLDELIRSMVTSLEDIAVDRSNFRFNSVFVLTLICIALGIVGYASYTYYKRRKLKWENLTEAQRAEFGRRRTLLSRRRKSNKSSKRNSFGRRRKSSKKNSSKKKKTSFGKKRKVSRKKRNSRK